MKTYSVWFQRDEYQCLFIAGLQVSLGGAQSIADNITEEFGFSAWVEED